MERVLVTGGAGFIGSNFIRHLLTDRQQYSVLNLDLLTYAGNLANLSGVQAHPQYRFVQGDIADTDLVERVFSEGIDLVINFAAESHVDRSIAEPGAFVRTNVLGTQVLLDAAHRHGVRKFVQISTDEVYGALGADAPRFTETTPLDPSSPYSASKAAADLLVTAYGRTYGLPVNITRCSNNYGPYQFPEKLIPLMITRALQDLALPLYGDGQQVRDWLHVADHCEAVLAVVERGRPGEVYNIGAENEWTNLAVVREIVARLGKPESLIRFVADRPGHDRRYAIDAAKIRRELGWEAQRPFSEGQAETLEWYCRNEAWWQPVMKPS